MNSFTFNTNLFGLEVEIDATYYPGESQTWDSPGEPASIEINSVTCNGITLDLTDVYIGRNRHSADYIYDLLEEKAQNYLEKSYYEDEPPHYAEEEVWR